MTELAFLTEPVPERSVLLPVLPGVSRIVADNPSRMTYHGTNTYLLEGDDGVTVLDPGPDSAEHVADIVRLAPGPIVRILLSHTHRDHFGGVAALKQQTGAPTLGWYQSADEAFTPDVKIHDGETVVGMEAVFTPGHAADHLCFARPDGVMFSADHVMGWSSSIVSPPGGNMADYFASLRRLLARGETTYLPGHGPMLTDPHPYVTALLDHRIARENAIAAELEKGPNTTVGLVEALYSKIDPILKMAAERNVLAHLMKLQGEGRVTRRGDDWHGG